MGGSSARGQGRRSLLGGCLLFEWVTGLDVAGGSLKTGRAFVQVAMDMDVPELPTLEAGLMISGVISGKRYIMVAAGPPDFGASDGIIFFFGQKGRRDGGGRVLRSSCSFLNESLIQSQFL